MTTPPNDPAGSDASRQDQSAYEGRTDSPRPDTVQGGPVPPTGSGPSPSRMVPPPPDSTGETAGEGGGASSERD